LEISGDVLSTADMVVQRRDGPRRLREIDDDDDDVIAKSLTLRIPAVTLNSNRITLTLVRGRYIQVANVLLRRLATRRLAAADAAVNCFFPSVLLATGTAPHALGCRPTDRVCLCALSTGVRVNAPARTCAARTPFTPRHLLSYDSGCSWKDAEI